jgi:hypothetical protein
MSHIVQKTFKDKDTNKTYEKGSVYQHEDEQRLKNLEYMGYLSKQDKKDTQMEKQDKELEKKIKKKKD